MTAGTRRSSEPNGGAPWHRLLRDPWVRAAGLGWLAYAALVAVVPEALSRTLVDLGPLTLLTLTSVLWLRPVLFPDPTERQFWRDLGLGLLAWLTGRSVSMVAGPSGLLWANLLADLLYTAFFVLWALALQRRPHSPPSSWSDTFVPSLTRATGLVFIVGMFGYLEVLPSWLGVQPGPGSVASLALHPVLDFYLFALLVFRVASCRVGRWRRLYGLLTLALGWTLVGDLLETYHQVPSASALTWDPVLARWWGPIEAVPPLILLVVARWRSLDPPGRPEGPAEAPFAAHVAPVVHTLALALTLPVLHIVYHRLSLTRAVLESYHEIYVLIWLLTLGTLAALHHRSVRGQLLAMARDRQRLENALEDSGTDVRLMVELRQSEDALGASEESFAQALRHCPEAISLTTLGEGRHVRFNQRYADLLGFDEEEIRDRTSRELGLWAAPWQRARLVEELDRVGVVRDMPLTLRNHAGELRDLLVSARRLELDDEPHLLSVAVDVTGQRRSAEALRHETDLLDQLDGLALGLDLDLRILFWSEGVAHRTGLDAEAVAFHSLGLLLPGGRSDLARLKNQCAVERPWRGPLTLSGADQRRFELDARWFPIAGEDGALGSWLVLAAWPENLPTSPAG